MAELIIGLSFIGLIVVAMVYGNVSDTRERRRIEREYEELKGGEVYTLCLDIEINPFSGPDLFVATILEKKGGWVKFQHKDGTVVEQEFYKFRVHDGWKVEERQ